MAYNQYHNKSPEDAFSRLRVSESYTLGDYSHVYGLREDFHQVTMGGATISYTIYDPVAKLEVGVGENDHAIYQSIKHHQYIPGKSQLTYLSFILGEQTENITKRVGLYDIRNGVFLEDDGENYYFVLRTTKGGDVFEEERFIKSEWNINRCDGSLPHNFSIDFTKIQLMFIDYQWLGAGRIRLGFIYKGVLVYAHEIYNANIKNYVYWSNPSLPIKTEIFNTLASSGGYLKFASGSVSSEDGYEETGDIASINTNKQTITSVDGQKAAIALRIKSEYEGVANTSICNINKINILAEDALLKYELFRLDTDADIYGGTWESEHYNHVEYNRTIATFSVNFTHAHLLDSGFISGGKDSVTELVSSVGIRPKRDFIALSYDSTNSSAFVLIITALELSGGENNFRTAIQWREIH